MPRQFREHEGDSAQLPRLRRRAYQPAQYIAAASRLFIISSPPLLGDLRSQPSQFHRATAAGHGSTFARVSAGYDD